MEIIKDIHSQFGKKPVKAKTEAQLAADDTHELLGFRKKQPMLYVLANWLKKNNQNPYDLLHAAKQIKDKDLKRPIEYLIKMFQFKRV